MKFILSDGKEFPIQQMDIKLLHLDTRKKYLDELKEYDKFKNIEDYYIIEFILEENYPEDYYYTIGNYFNFENKKIVKIEYNNTQIIINLDLLVRIIRSEKPGESRLIFLQFKLKEE